jgi:hypothetical protein
MPFSLTRNINYHQPSSLLTLILQRHYMTRQSAETEKYNLSLPLPTSSHLTFFLHHIFIVLVKVILCYRWPIILPSLIPLFMETYEIFWSACTTCGNW